MASNHMNERVSYLYHPAILNFFINVIEATNAEGKRTGMCRVMAGDSKAILIWD